MAQSEVKKHLARMATDFEKSAAGLGVVSSKDTLRFEKGTYEILFLKPSKRLATSLTVDREIVVLFTSFTDVQARTIGAVRHVIQKSNGRLEGTVAIVVHCDERGNGKLRNWGRESGIAVLPVEYRDGLPKGDEFEHLLCHEMFSNDPFDVTGPVSGDAQFYGRRTEAQDLARRLQGGQICSALGIRKIGKTSIINRVVTDLRDNYRCLCLMIDCSRDQIWKLTSSQLLAAISMSLELSLSDGAAYRSVEPIEPAPAVNVPSSDVLSTIKRCDRPLILFFDELDYITPSSPTAPHWKTEFNQFWRNVRSIYQESKRIGAILSVFIGGVSSKWFSVESIDGIENAALAFVPEDYMSPLPRGATIAMIRTIGRVAGLHFDDEACEKIAESCGDMPFWVRKAGSYVHRNIDVGGRPTTVIAPKVATILHEFIQAEGATLAHVALRHLFRVYPEVENSMKLCHAGCADKVSSSQIAVLQRYGLVSQSDTARISGQMLRLGFELYLDERARAPAAVETTSATVPDRSEIDEWAEELAVISKRRNLLEKRLRSIFLNFIRVDHLKSNPSIPVPGRILSALPADRRKKLQNRIAEEVVEGMYWKELVDLIDKEWSLFGQLFGDKTRFREHCGVINDRPDAHAKSVDAADLALYRRSLKIIEDLIGKIM